MKFLIFLCCFFIMAVRAETTAFFSPSTACEDHIIALLNNAKKQIDIAVYSINNTQIVSAIKQAHKRGIPIRILTDKTQAANRSSKVWDLYNAGLNIRVHSKNKIEHNKFTVVDQDVVMTGSYNWTNPASLRNSENCLMIWDEPSTVAQYQERFEYLWQINTQEKSDQWFRVKAHKENQ
ncbi:MAG: phospholipase D-like domain-containing protein [Alphaproteobacteria bacterium]